MLAHVRGGRAGQPTAQRRDEATSEHVNVATDRPVNVGTREHVDVATDQRLNVAADRPVNVGTSEHVNGTYERLTVYLAPDQRRWVKNSAKALPVDWLSSSDVVRLAIVRLRQDIEGGEVELTEALTRQAYEEAERLTGRRNRGLPR